MAHTTKGANLNSTDLCAISQGAADVFVSVIQNLESVFFQDYVMCFPDEFKDAKDGIDNYVEFCVTSKVKSLKLPTEIAEFVHNVATTMVSTYVLENYIVEMVEGYRAMALEDEDEFEDEDYCFSQNRLGEAD